ncbi:MAG TPA: MaoC family dehydratase [Dermatophilaceae bacterium]|nr:MaoC family dehydratase [Dermatophilaceae bacterium]
MLIANSLTTDDVITDGVIIDNTLTDASAAAIAAAMAPGPMVIHGLEGLRAAVGTDLGVSPWVTIEQDSVNTFAQVINDNQWIHVDPLRAKDGPFGGTIAHGFLTMGLATSLLWGVATVSDVDVILNYGLNKVRFPAPVMVGSRLRMHVSVAEVKEIKGGLEVVYHLVYESEGTTKPPCVADAVLRYYV